MSAANFKGQSTAALQVGGDDGGGCGATSRSALGATATLRATLHQGKDETRQVHDHIPAGPPPCGHARGCARPPEQLARQRSEAA